MTAIHPTKSAQDISKELGPTLGQTKRALEWWSCSEEFRQRIAEDPEAVGRDYNLGFNPELIRPLWDPFFAVDLERAGGEVHPAVTEYREFFNGKTKWRDEIKAACSPEQPRFRAWRLRQIARNTAENGAYDGYIIHTPMAIELTDGCTVGCWFCGVGATKYAEAWPYTDENAELWRGVLRALYAKTGDAGRYGFCYWATDPLDNPDYESFAGDFADIIGLYPQTTTAQAHKYPERIRKLLRDSESRGCRVNRFSVVSERLLRDIYASYTPDEMTHVEIVAQMHDGTVAKALTGAFRNAAAKQTKIIDREQRKLNIITERTRQLAAHCGEELSDDEQELAQPGTIACVSGFLLNMVKRTVKLISPCRASADWPLGYIVFEERSFADAAELERHLDELVDKYMPITLEPTDVIRFNPNLQYRREPEGFTVFTRLNRIQFHRPALADYVGALGDLIHAGNRTAAQIAFALFWMHGVPEVNTLSTLQAIFDAGVLVDREGRIAGELGA